MKLTSRSQAPSLSPNDIMHVVVVDDHTQSPQGSSYYTTLQQIMNLSSSITVVSYWTAGTGTNSVKTISGSNIASGNYSYAEGQNTQATGLTSHAEGILTIAGGDYSHAEGYQTKTIGNYSHSEGQQTQAVGVASHAEGLSTSATTDASHAEGELTYAYGEASHAEGLLTKALGDWSHAEGDSSQSIGYAAHAENVKTIAKGDNSHAGGNYSTASGTTSFVHGDHSVAGGTNTVVFGANITGLTDNTTYVDKFNIKTLVAGTSVNNLGIDVNGNIIIGSAGGGGTTIRWYAEPSIAPPISPKSVGTNAIAIGNQSEANSTDNLSFGTTSGLQSGNNNNSSVFLGYGSGYRLSGGTNSMNIGVYAGAYSSGNTSANIIGDSAGYSSSGCTNSNFIGKSAGQSAINSTSCNFIGYQAGYASTACTSCNLIGNGAGFQSDTLTNCNFIGLSTGGNADGSFYCNALGSYAAYSTIGSSYCLYLGYYAGYSAGTTSYNNFIGYQSGLGTASSRVGNNNIIIGTNITLPNGTANGINIGGVIFGTGTYATTTGSPSSANNPSAKIGINTVLPTEALHVTGNILATGKISAQNDIIAFATSDIRLKDNITKIENPLGKISKLNGYMFDWNDKQDTYIGHDIGVIAQEVEEVVPEVVTTREDGYKAVKYEKLIALLISGINELQEEVKQLKDKLNG